MFKHICVNMLGQGAVLKVMSELSSPGHISSHIETIRDTGFIVGAYHKEGRHTIFVKPSLGSRAIDCLGYCGPSTTTSHFVGKNLIMYTWTDERTKLITNYMFNINGRYLGPVKDPIGEDKQA